MPGSDDLAPFIVPQTSGGIRYGQGKIISFNTATFENTIEWNRIRLKNLPLLGTTDALAYAPGQTVALLSIDASGAKGATQWAILGRFFVPGTDNAEDLVEWMTTALGRQVAAAVFADRIATAEDPNAGIRNAAGFGDLAPVTAGPPPPLPGPSVSLNISPAGVALVDLTARISPALVGASSVLGQFGQVGVTVSGATTVPATFGDSLLVELQDTDPSTGIIVGFRATAAVRITGLNEGLHTFKMVYSSGSSDDREQVIFGDRTIKVTGL